MFRRINFRINPKINKRYFSVFPVRDGWTGDPIVSNFSTEDDGTEYVACLYLFSVGILVVGDKYRNYIDKKKKTKKDSSSLKMKF